MSQETEIQLLINSFSPKEKLQFLEGENALSITAKHADLLFHQPKLPKTEIAKKLKLSEKKYKTACETTYNLLWRFFLLHKKPLANDVEYKLREIQLMAELMKEKGLILQAKKKIEEAIEIAKHHELFGDEISLHHQYLQILSYQQQSVIHEKALILMKRIENAIELQNEESKLHLIYSQLLSLRYKMAFRTSPEEQEEIKQISFNLHQFLPEKLGSNMACIYYYQSCLLTAFMLGQTENIASWNEYLLQYWQQKNHLISLHPDLFTRSGSLQSYTHFLIKDIESAKNYLDQYRYLATAHLPSLFYKNWFGIIDFHTIVKVLHKTCQYKELGIYFPTKWPPIHSLLPILRDVEKQDILLTACITLFVLQRWQDAETIILEVKANNQKIKRADTLYFTFVFHCLILYEQREWSRLDSLIHSEYHFLYTNKALRPFEKDMLLFIKKLPVAMFKGKAKETMISFLKKLDVYRNNHMQKLFFATFDFYSWIESKIEGVSYTTYMENKCRH